MPVSSEAGGSSVQRTESFQVFDEPFDRQLLSFFAFLVVDAVVPDVFDGDQFLDASCSFMCCDGMVFVVE